MSSSSRTTVLEVSGVQWASQQATAEVVLSRRPGVTAVDVNPVAQTATVRYDPAVTSVEELAGWVRDCGYHCAGRPVPNHICDPLAEPRATSSELAIDRVAETPHPAPAAHDGHDVHAGHEASSGMTAQDAMGHGGHHGGMSMDAMVADMRRRFLVAAVLSVPILLWSPIGSEVLGWTTPAPFGLRDDVFSLLLSLPVVFYSAWIFFDGAYRALRARTLDMMVLVAVAVGAGWGYSVVVTFTGGGEVFY